MIFFEYQKALIHQFLIHLNNLNFTTNTNKFNSLFCTQKPALNVGFKVQNKSDSDFVWQIQLIRI